MEKKFIISLKSRTDVFRLKNALRKKGFGAAVVPTPKGGGSGCSVSIEILPTIYKETILLASEIGVEISSILVKESSSLNGGVVRHNYRKT